MSSTSSALRRRPVGMLQKSRIVTTGLVERVKVLLAFVLVFAGVTALGVASSGPAVAATAVVSETTGLNAIACPNTIICDAVGSNGRKGVVVPIVNGVVGNVVTVPGTRSFVGIACPSATICEAVGSTGSAGVVVPVTLADDGTPTPGTAVSVSGATALQSVACPSATTCEASGFISSPFAGVVASLAIAGDGTPTSGSATVASGSGYIYGIACPSTTICEGATSNTTGTGAIVLVVNGTPGSVVTVSGTGAFLGITCLGATSCEAVSSSGSVGAVAPIAVAGDGTPTPESTVGVPDSNTFASIACSSPTSCEVSGSPDQDGGSALVAPITIAGDGITPMPGSAQAEPGTSYLQSIASTQGVNTFDSVGTNSSNEGVVVTIGPVQVTCGKVHYSGGAVALANCNHNVITGGAGTFTQTALPNPVTETVTWANGATSVATENIDVLEGTADKCAPRAGFQGHENKVTGTITGGTQLR
jgi:hypothetical protein